MPPTSVPDKEPMPPITTASKAKISYSRTGIGRKRFAHGKEHAGQPRGRYGDRRRDGIDRAGIDADQFGGVGVFGGGANRPTERV